MFDLSKIYSGNFNTFFSFFLITKIVSFMKNTFLVTIAIQLTNHMVHY